MKTIPLDSGLCVVLFPSKTGKYPDPEDPDDLMPECTCADGDDCPVYGWLDRQYAKLDKEVT